MWELLERLDDGVEHREDIPGRNDFAQWTLVQTCVDLDTVELGGGTQLNVVSDVESMIVNDRVTNVSSQLGTGTSARPVSVRHR